MVFLRCQANEEWISDAESWMSTAYIDKYF